jgi:hypothetical protein
MPDASQTQHHRGGWWDQEQQTSYKMQPADIEESMEEHGFMVSCLVTVMAALLVLYFMPIS